MSARGLRYSSTAAMPEGLRQAAERAVAAKPAGTKRQHAPNPTEHVEAVRLMEQVRMQERAHPALSLFHAIPNGGDRHKATAGKMRAEGQRAGVPDYCLPVARGGFHGLYIELKSLTGYPSREQREWIARLTAEGFRAEVCRGWQEAWAVLADYLGIDSTQPLRR